MSEPSELHTDIVDWISGDWGRLEICVCPGESAERYMARWAKGALCGAMSEPDIMERRISFCMQWGLMRVFYYYLYCGALFAEEASAMLFY
jgi:hypothetical protein